VRTTQSHRLLIQDCCYGRVLDVRPRTPTRIRTADGRDRDRTGGSDGNRRLTGSVAAILLVLLAAEGATVLAIRPLVSVHVFLGMLLIPPVGLKLASTGYRMARYYGGAREYRRDGPPALPLRLLGPVVVLSTVALFASGVALVVLGPQGGAVLGLHKASFVVWFFAMAVHVLAHLLRIPRLASADWTGHERLPGSSLRRWLLAGSLVAGLIVALATVHLAAPWHQFQSFDG
jgi:hypothetical protein